jgi:hypothetical protein
MEVEVRDSVTGALASAGATLVARDGAYIDSVTVTADFARITMAENRTGTYTLTISKQGYLTWVRAGIVAQGDECGPSAAVYVLARLRPTL